MMKKELLEKARKEIKKEMDEVGFIDDSDNIDRFLDNLVEQLAETEQEELLDLIKNEIMIEYNKIGFINDRGDFVGCYYSTKKDAIKWANNWQEQNIFEAHKEFIETYGIDVTLEQFAEAYGVDIEDYLEN